MTIEIPLTRGRVALIDDEDFELVTQRKWQAVPNRNGGHGLDCSWYARACFHTSDGPWRQVMMIVDHINGESLDNRRSNLRIATTSLNGANTCLNSNNTSGFKGVYRYTNATTWCARLGHENGYIGSFKTREEAAHAYDQAARERYGEFARLNFPREGELGCR